MINLVLGLVLSTLKVMGAKKLFPMFIRIFEKDMRKWAKGTEFTEIDDNLVDVLMKVCEEMEK